MENYVNRFRKQNESIKAVEVYTDESSNLQLEMAQTQMHKKFVITILTSFLTQLS